MAGQMSQWGGVGWTGISCHLRCQRQVLPCRNSCTGLSTTCLATSTVFLTLLRYMLGGACPSTTQCLQLIGGFGACRIAEHPSVFASASLCAGIAGLQKPAAVAAAAAASTQHGLEQQGLVKAADFAAAMHRVGPSIVRGAAVEVAPVSWVNLGGYDEVKKRLRQAVEWPLQHTGDQQAQEVDICCHSSRSTRTARTAVAGRQQQSAPAIAAVGAHAQVHITTLLGCASHYNGQAVTPDPPIPACCCPWASV
jgi:hypothetical protein